MGFPFLCDRIRPSASKFFKLIFISNQEYFLASERRRAPPIRTTKFLGRSTNFLGRLRRRGQSVSHGQACL